MDGAVQRFVEHLRLIAATRRSQGGQHSLKVMQIGGKVIAAYHKGIGAVAVSNPAMAHIRLSGQKGDLFGNIGHRCLELADLIVYRADHIDQEEQNEWYR